jgi:hypothetical protein
LAGTYLLAHLFLLRCIHTVQATDGDRGIKFSPDETPVPQIYTGSANSSVSL